ncbi:hypothetical protein CCHR01_00167 [Colletotrichum chrysophilum]|uniref:Uncharacterized protein n=1 Tax=Colletotrichum chrysophilum TaxID=1836956 RepID=A0AAD9AYK7_9PEZI|nr:hypothetical protein CCHR01_00167 [Colletotrichum chrysophilum]
MRRTLAAAASSSPSKSHQPITACPSSAPPSTTPLCQKTHNGRIPRRPLKHMAPIPRLQWLLPDGATCAAPGKTATFSPPMRSRCRSRHWAAAGFACIFAHVSFQLCHLAFSGRNWVLLGSPSRRSKPPRRDKADKGCVRAASQRGCRAPIWTLVSSRIWPMCIVSKHACLGQSESLAQVI